jgi:hypothetical protein
VCRRIERFAHTGFRIRIVLRTTLLATSPAENSTIAVYGPTSLPVEKVLGTFSHG